MSDIKTRKGSTGLMQSRCMITSVELHGRTPAEELEPDVNTILKCCNHGLKLGDFRN